MSGKAMFLLQSDVIKELNGTPTPSPAPSNGISLQGGSSLDSILQLVGLVFLLIVILIAAYYTSKFVGRFTMGQLKNSNFNVIDTYRISQNKVMQIVKVGNKFIVIAISKDTISYITELDETEVFIKEVQTKENLNFKQILDKLRNKSGDESTSK